MKILMLVTTDVAHDSRVLREAEALSRAGHRVDVIGKDVPVDWTAPDGVSVSSVGLAGSGGTDGFGTSGGGVSGAAAALVRRAGRWLLLPEHRARVWRRWTAGASLLAAGREYDAVHAHDFNTLPLAAALADAEGARLVYDAHEWWTGRQRHGRPTPWLTRRERARERALLGRADAVLTVSQTIAERLAEAASGPVSVVRNTFGALARPAGPPRWAPAGVVYAGRIGGGRDLEAVVGGTADARMGLVLMGGSEPGYLRRLRPAVGGVDVEIRPAVPVDEVDEVLRGRGICAVPLADSCDNHRCALPNKLFQAVRAGVPVVAADLPELRAVVGRYGLGELYRPGDAVSFGRAARRVADGYPQLLRSVEAAGAELCWERDAEVLLGVYGRLGGPAAVGGRGVAA